MPLYSVGACLASTNRDTKITRQARRYLYGVSVRDLTEPSGLTIARGSERTVIQVGLALLHRGRPTFSSPNVERSILRSLEPATSFAVSETGEDAIEFTVRPQQLPLANWSQLLARAHLPVDSRACLGFDSLPFDSTEEGAFFSEYAADTLRGAAAFLEPQRPIGTMIESDDGDLATGLVHQRVDFALESPGGTRVVIEIDGEQHCEPGQAQLDQERNRVLSSAGWTVLRVPSKLLHDDRVGALDAELAELVSAVERDRYLTSCQVEVGQPLGETAEGRAASRLVITPHAIARIQLALLLALERGVLSLTRPTWRIAVIERDVACAQLAVVDLLELLDHLCALYDVSFAPHVQLQVFRTHAYLETDLDLSAYGSRVKERLTCTAALWERGTTPMVCDVLLDVGVLAHGTLSYGDDLVVERAARQATWAAILRTAHRSRPRVRLASGTPRSMTDPDKHEDCLVYFLQLLFRKRAFREGQVQIIARALRRQSVIGLLPTGAGKSITYQLPTLLSPGFALVVDPLKSLMQDQVENLALSGIDAAIAIHSDLSIQEQTAQVRELHDGDPRFAFVAPERLQMHAFRRQLKEVSTFKPVSFVVVDEAHCVSEWGHDFRPSYLNLGRLGRDLCRYEGTEPPLVALTGTASQSVLGDIQREIGVLDPEAAITPTTFDRPELRFVIERVPSADKDTKLVGLLKRLPDDLSVPTSQFFDPRTAGLIFCRYVGSEFGVEQVKNTIQQRFVEEGVEVRLFSGSSPKGFGGDSTQWGREKIRVQRDFKANRFPVLVATPAFGMGIDKPNIRYTIHYGIPPSLEAFYQEAGRAGRDRSPAVCAIVFSDDDAAAARDFLDVNLSAEEAIARFQQLRWSERGDAARIMYFQANSFKGASVEFEKVQSMYREHVRPCWDKHSLKPGDRHSVIIPWPPGADAKNDAERAIYRLLLLGLLDDYTVDFAHRRFEATCRMLEASAVKQNLYAYVRRYKSRSYSVALDDYLTKSLLEDPIERCIDGLTWFVYEEIEKKRRAALRTIVEVMRDSTDGEGLRHALLSYLEDSPFTARVTTLAGRVEPADWWEAFKAVGDAHDARQLLGQCRRGLESNPDHPGLHFLSGLARAALPTLNVTAAADDLQAGLESLHKNYGLTEATVTQDLVAILHQIGQGAFEQVTAEVLRKYNNEDFARAAYQFARDPALRRRCAMPMLAAIRSQIASVSQSLLEV